MRFSLMFVPLKVVAFFVRAHNLKSVLYYISCGVLSLSLFSISISTKAGTPEEDCPSFDFRDRFGSEKNQGFHQICWAMAGSSLIEEEACLMDHKYCGVSFSPVDIASCTSRVGHDHEENVVDRAIICARDRGVCLDHMAPFVDFRKNESLWAFLTFSGRFKRTPLFKMYEKYKFAQQHRSAVNEKQLSSIEQEFINEFRKTFAYNDFTDKKLLEILKKSKDESEFLDKTLISNACSENRVRFEGIDSVYTQIFPEMNPRILSFYTAKEIEQFKSNSTPEKLLSIVLKQDAVFH
ncbi:MAG: hypothetical protein ACXVCN_18575 [Bdellovibrio sp.]